MRFLSRKTAGGEIKTKDRNVWRGGGREKKEREREKETEGLKNGRMGMGDRVGGEVHMKRAEKHDALEGKAQLRSLSFFSIAHRLSV